MEINDIATDSEENFIVLMKCCECGKELNRSKEINGKELHKMWMRVVFSGPLAAKSCPNGCRATYSDCNANISYDIIKSDPTQHEV